MSFVRIEYRTARPLDADEGIHDRGLTRENAVSPLVLAEIGITVESCAKDSEAGKVPVCVCGGHAHGWLLLR